jgi:trk system potassium uptake protein TrkA
VVEEKIPPGARAVGKSIQELELPERCIIAAIIRKGEMVVPRGATIMEQDDEVLAIADRQGAEKLAALLAPPAGFNSRPARKPEKG